MEHRDQLQLVSSPSLQYDQAMLLLILASDSGSVGLISVSSMAHLDLGSKE